MIFADRLANVETSAIRELFQAARQTGHHQLRRRLPDPALFDAEGIRIAVNAALAANPGPVRGTAPPRASTRCARASPAFMAAKGATVAPQA